ncbi:MAG: alcohol dehydrogenase catalytic domain-containing protein [Phycisphaeraceae bacterium]|nr:alcohol dehydrogenase catalytic domain-containing protein [Phycisphaeraceae bacterium]
MRALVLEKQHVRFDANHADPAPRPGEVVIRPTRMGVCATDLELCKGYMDFRGVLGHEFVGIVEQAPGNKQWLGKRVVGSINCVCGKCDMCKAGLREHCRQRTVLGIAGRDGCFADRFTLPAANLYEIPDHVDDDRAVFVEPLAAAFQVLRQLTIEGRPYITVLGDGRLGLLCAQVVSKLNATVRCIGKHPRKLELCEKWGVKHRPLEDVGLRQDQDIVIDATGSPTGLTTAMQMVRPRGTIVLKTTISPSQHLPGAGVDISPLVIHEINLIGSRCGPFPDAIDALSQESIDVVSLISRRLKLADGVEALKLADQGDVLKVLLEP